MKILIISIHADPTIHPGAQEGGGTHMYIGELMNMLIAKQVETLIITRKASEGKDEFVYGNVKLIRLPIGPPTQWDKNNLDGLENDLNIAIEAALLKENFCPNLIQSVYWYSGRAGVFFSKKLKIPLIYTVISNGIRKQKNGYSVSETRKKEEKKIFEKASVIISICNEEKHDITEYYNIPPEKIKVIGRGVDNLFLKDLYDKKGTLRTDKPLKNS